MTLFGRPGSERRRGKGYFPPNPNQWRNEANGLDLRDALLLPPDVELDCEAAFRLLPHVTLLAHGDLPMAAKFVEHLRNAGQRSWSGMGIPLNGGGTAVIYNDSHSRTRIRATLMEEFFHLWLKHPTSTIRVYDQHGHLRTYNGTIEIEAYHSGAAALVPFKGLKALVEGGMPVQQIALTYDVSPELVEFRAKVTKLYKRLRR